MTIGEILEALKQGKALANIAKELTVGKEKLSKALQKAGYEYNRGNRKWAFAETGEEPLNQAYTDFVESSRNVKKQPVIHAPKEVVATTEKAEASKNQQTNVPTKERKNEPTKELTKERTNVVRKRSSFDIDVALMKDLKIQAVIHGKNVYEIVENAIRKELAQMKKEK